MNKAAESRRAKHLGPDRRRPQVLDAALAIAAEEGLAGVTMAAVSARLRVSRPVVYDCYPGRGELLAALLDRERQIALERLLAILPPLKTSSVQQMFVDGFTSLLGDVAERPASWRVMFANDPEPVLAEAVSAGRAQLASRVEEVMRPLFARWDIADPQAPPVLVAVFLGICEVAVGLQLDNGGAPEELARIVGPAAYRALRARS